MKFSRRGDAGSELPVVSVETDAGEQHFDLSGHFADINADFFRNDGVARVSELLASGALEEIVLEDGERFGPPIARPASVVCIGMNYAAHAAESGSAPPTEPVVFLKPSNTVVGPFDDAPIPPGAATYDWEVELAVVMGKPASYTASPEEAFDAVAGYAIANDLSERDYQLKGNAGQWTRGKSLPRSTPLGPYLVPKEDVDVNNLRLRSWVNDDPRQDSFTSDLIFDVPTLVHYISQYMELEPGDLILTGTPEGVALSGRFPYLQSGDEVRLEIDGLGTQEQNFYSTTED